MVETEKCWYYFVLISEYEQFLMMYVRNLLPIKTTQINLLVFLMILLKSIQFLWSLLEEKKIWKSPKIMKVIYGGMEPKIEN